MSAVTHHIPDAMMTAYASGQLPHAFSLVVASHISMCAECRARFETHNMVAGLLLEDEPLASVSRGMKADLLSKLDDPTPPEPEFLRSGVFPGPVVAQMQGRAPRWKRLGMGVRQDILCSDKSGSARLLFIPPGQAVPDHSHAGIELTLVLQGSFHDETGRFGPGDLEVADEHVEHTPTAGEGPPCICLAATDAPLKFNAFVPRLLQPLFRI